jgi:hypothetical protein
MALDATLWQVNTDKSIQYIGGAHGSATANYVTVLELHRWLQDLADDASVLDHGNDDFMDITTLNPTDKKFDTIITLVNGYTLSTTGTPSEEFIYKGSIIQGSGGSEVIWDGVKIVASVGVITNVIQDGAVLTNKFWNTIPNGESTPGINRDLANGVAAQFMVKVRTAGVNVDNTTLLFTTREQGKTYSEFRIPATGRGENTVPLTYADDLNNTTAGATVDTWSTIANVTSGWNQIDVNQDTTNENYYSEWNRDVYDINQFYERMKRITENGSTTQLYGLDGELFRGITHSISNQAGGAPGAFVQGGATALSWGAGVTAGTGQILANDTTSDILYIQLLTGVIPGNAVTVTQGANSATSAAASAVSEKTVSTPMCGASTGSSIVGAYGFTLEYADLAVSDKIQALDGVTRQPPNNVSFSVNGIQTGYRVLVGPEDGGGGLLYTQLSNTGALTGAAITSVVVDEALPANSPTSGTIRIERADGQYTRHAYSAVGTVPTTFTIASHNFSTNNAAIGANVFISYIDQASAGTTVSYNTVQTVSQTLYVETRFGGTGPNYTDSIKPASSTGTLGSNGGSATLSPVSDA